MNRGEFGEHYDKKQRYYKLIKIQSLIAYHNKKIKDSENEIEILIEDKKHPNYCNYHKARHPSKKISKMLEKNILIKKYKVTQNNLKFFQLLAKQENITQDIKTGTTFTLSYNKMNSLKGFERKRI